MWISIFFIAGFILALSVVLFLIAKVFQFLGLKNGILALLGVAGVITIVFYADKILDYILDYMTEENPILFAGAILFFVITSVAIRIKRDFKRKI